ncbi:MAG: IS66 family insertion sequence element accessory protein TnpB [Nitrospirota bacterium]|nr:IS66 family insertion sequence element accessory protein TnpB [Nitrospirota bacterium]
MQTNNLNELQLLWLSRVEEFKKSGLTQAGFCKLNEFNLKPFNYWYRKFKKIEPPSQAETPKWISVNVTEPLKSDFLSVRIGSATIEVMPGFNKHLLAEVVEALGKSC